MHKLISTHSKKTQKEKKWTGIPLQQSPVKQADLWLITQQPPQSCQCDNMQLIARTVKMFKAEASALLQCCLQYNPIIMNSFLNQLDAAKQHSSNKVHNTNLLFCPLLSNLTRPHCPNLFVWRFFVPKNIQYVL